MDYLSHKQQGKIMGKILSLNIWKNLPTEYQECKTFWAWLETYPPTKGFAYHINNEGKRSHGLAHLLYLIGLRKGVSDYCLAVPRGTYGALYIEMKRRDKTKSKITTEQSEWIKKMLAIGNQAHVAYGADEAIEFVLQYMKGSKNGIGE